MFATYGLDRKYVMAATSQLFLASASMHTFAVLAVLLGALYSQDSLADESAKPSTAPIGNYLWYPEPGGPKSDADCEALVNKLKPTNEIVRQWLWGQIPNTDYAHMPFFLIVSPGRIETTFAAEGDYDYGDVVFGQSYLGETTFTLTPDDHPLERIKGKITTPDDSQIVSVTLYDVPVDNYAKDRVSYFCRFEDNGTEI